MVIPDKTDNKKAAVIVAHPDDETIWAGGTILMHPDWRWNVLALCRASDAGRAPKFRRVLQEFDATGNIGDLDDSPGQPPLPEREVQQAIMALLPEGCFDIIITHSPFGEYTRHLRHEEAGRAVAHLWEDGKIRADELWIFAYEDGVKKYFPRAIRSAHRLIRLSDAIWQKKYHLITVFYGFGAGSYEAQTTPREEAFWCFHSPLDLRQWLAGKGGKQ
jgi:LmbE family N-acetylglucosaminyl deacetylase